MYFQASAIHPSVCLSAHLSEYSMPLITSIWHGQGWVAKAQGGTVVMIRSMDYNRYKDERKILILTEFLKHSSSPPFPIPMIVHLLSWFHLHCGSNWSFGWGERMEMQSLDRMTMTLRPIKLIRTKSLWPRNIYSLTFIIIWWSPHPCGLHCFCSPSIHPPCTTCCWRRHAILVRKFLGKFVEPFVRYGRAFLLLPMQATHYIARYSSAFVTYSWAGKSSSQVTPPLLNHCSLMSLNDTGKLSYVSMGGVVTAQALPWPSKWGRVEEVDSKSYLGTKSNYADTCSR